MIEINTLLAGIFYLIAGCSGLTRHFLLRPVDQPCAERRHSRGTLAIVFVFSVALFFFGLHYLSVWYDGEAILAPPGSTGIGALTAMSVCVYKLTMLRHTLTTNAKFVLTPLWHKE